MDVDARILDILSKGKGGYLSGEDIADKLGISRAGVWKRIRILKERYKYPIESKISQGYRLSEPYLPLDETRLISSLSSGIMGRRLHLLRSVDSTNTIAYEMALKGAEEGTVVIADSQDKGRGRLGRRWESPPGVNIYLSLILRPTITPSHAPHLTFISSIALVDTIKKNCPGLEPLIKWPNDIIINHRKVAGILTEMNSEMDRVIFVVIGIGINVNMSVALLPEGLRTVATSLREEMGETIDRNRLVIDLLKGIETSYEMYKKEGFQKILDIWRSHAYLDGRFVEVSHFSERVRGVVIGVDEDGRLLVKDDGELIRVIAGDVSIV